MILSLVAAPAHSEPAAEAASGKSYVLVSDKAERTPGLKLTFSDTMTMSGGKFSMNTPQGVFEGTMDLKTTKVIETRNETALKIKAKITTSENKQTMTMNGQELPQPPQAMPLVNVPLVISFTDGVWKASREDGEKVNDADAVELSNLEKSVSGVEDKNIYGTKPRKPGDNWVVDAKEMGMVDVSDDVEGSVKLNFDKVADHEGVECAFLTGKIEMAGSPPANGGVTGGKMELNGTFKIIRSLESQIDVFRELNGTMKMEMITPGGTMKISGPTVMKKPAVVGK